MEARKPQSDAPPGRGAVVAGAIAYQATDAQLVLRILDGDRTAEEILFFRHIRNITTTVTRLLGNEQDADDIVQDTFVTALTDLGQLRDPAAFRGWLLKVAVRKVQQRFRKRKLLRLLGLDRSDPYALEFFASKDASPEVRAELKLLEKKLAALSDSERLAWVLRHVEGASLSEVADAIDCSLATAKRRIAAAREKLQVHLEGGASDD